MKPTACCYKPVRIPSCLSTKPNITVNKAVVLVLTNAHKPLLRRELLYTGVTRAKELLVIIAPRSALSSAIDAHGVDRRCTGLVDRLSVPVAARPSKRNNPR